VTDTLVIVYAAIGGLLIGSFLTVVVDRVPKGESIVSPGSRCGSCDLRLGPLDLVPVVSWVVLRGRCRRCRTNIGIEPLVLELTTASLFVAMAAKFGLSWELFGYLALAAGLVANGWIDLRTMYLERSITEVTAALMVPFLVVGALVADEPRRIVTMIGGAVIAFAFMGGVYWVANRRYGKGQAFGFGDVVLSPLLGAALGWLGLPFVPVGLFLGFFIGAVIGVAAMAAGDAGMKTQIPFGPSLAAGTIAAVFVGRPIIDTLWGF
jgi:leader peptidase (prepilin peptidase) / N-methyltransferase